MRKKYGWSAFGIVGLVFAPIGLFFVLLALAVSQAGFTWNRPGGETVFLTVSGGVGGFFLVLGLFFLSKDLRRRNRLRQAYLGGMRVDARITGAGYQPNVRVNGSSPRYIECEYTDPSGVVRRYRSRLLYRDEEVEALLKAGTVPVYVDRFDSSVGFVDV
jgi:hypothetical protein